MNCHTCKLHQAVALKYPTAFKCCIVVVVVVVDKRIVAKDKGRKDWIYFVYFQYTELGRFRKDTNLVFLGDRGQEANGCDICSQLDDLVVCDVVMRVGW